jgi:hypothetical protein
MQYKEVGECWEWIGAVEKDNYGVFQGEVAGVMYHRAHRFSWAFYTQSRIPKGMFICHSCDNPRCVNPAHLWMGTLRENYDDMVRKGRRRTEQRGEMSHRAKLTENQAKAILIDPRPYAEIAASYGVAATTITSIKNRESWAHVQVDHIAKNSPGGPHRRGMGTKITEEIVREIRKSTEQGVLLAQKYGISNVLVSNIRRRKVWKHVTD